MRKNGNSGDRCGVLNGSKDSNKASQALLFAKNFIRHPGMVGWVLPSSRFLVNEVLKQIDFQRADVIVEYGPGVGSFTQKMLERMQPNARLIAVELNPEFYNYLKRTFKDKRLHLVNGSAMDIDKMMQGLGLSQADYVVSGIPFKTIPHSLRDEIVRKTHSVLKPDGSFLVYQFTGAVRPYLERVFSRVSRDFELLNVLPARLFYCAR